jgi:hypothetical protein
MVPKMMKVVFGTALRYEWYSISEKLGVLTSEGVGKKPNKNGP